MFITNPHNATNDTTLDVRFTWDEPQIPDHTSKLDEINANFNPSQMFQKFEA